jgi:hypothetical protein
VGHANRLRIVPEQLRHFGQSAAADRPRHGTIGSAFRYFGRLEEVKQEDVMGRGLLLWLLGIPLPIVILIWVLGGLHG